jgi:hypothetical protein
MSGTRNVRDGQPDIFVIVVSSSLFCSSVPALHGCSSIFRQAAGGRKSKLGNGHGLAPNASKSSQSSERRLEQIDSPNCVDSVPVLTCLDFDLHPISVVKDIHFTTVSSFSHFFAFDASIRFCKSALCVVLGSISHFCFCPVISLAGYKYRLMSIIPNPSEEASVEKKGNLTWVDQKTASLLNGSPHG